MDSALQRQKNKKLFMKRDAKLNERLKSDYIRNGIAVLPCNVSGMDDIVSHFSVKKYETTNPEFFEYIEATASYVPGDYPIVLEISGCTFTEEEKKTISAMIHEDFLYALGAIQQENKRQLIFSWIMLICMLITGAITFAIKGASPSIVEIAYVFFWFFADMVACYWFLDRFENKKKRLLAGRLADMTIRFREKFDDITVTDEDAQAVYEEMEKMTAADSTLEKD